MTIIMAKLESEFNEPLRSTHGVCGEFIKGTHHVGFTLSMPKFRVGRFKGLTSLNFTKFGSHYFKCEEDGQKYLMVSVSHESMEDIKSFELPDEWAVELGV